MVFSLFLGDKRERNKGNFTYSCLRLIILFCYDFWLGHHISSKCQSIVNQCPILSVTCVDRRTCMFNCYMALRGTCHVKKRGSIRQRYVNLTPFLSPFLSPRLWAISHFYITVQLSTRFGDKYKTDGNNWDINLAVYCLWQFQLFGVTRKNCRIILEQNAREVIVTIIRMQCPPPSGRREFSHLDPGVETHGTIPEYRL